MWQSMHIHYTQIQFGDFDNFLGKSDLFYILPILLPYIIACCVIFHGLHNIQQQANIIHWQSLNYEHSANSVIGMRHLVD